MALPTRTGLLICLAVPAVSVLVSLAPMRAIAHGHAGVRRQAVVRRPSPWRLVPAALGALLLTRTALWNVPPDTDVPASYAVWFVAGALLAGLGLPFAVPVVVRLLGDAGARWSPTPAVGVAARRLQLEATATTRAVAGVLAALFVTAGALCVLTAFERTPQYVRAQHAATVGPQFVQLWADRGLSPGDEQRLSRLDRAADGGRDRLWS